MLTDNNHMLLGNVLEQCEYIAKHYVWFKSKIEYGRAAPSFICTHYIAIIGSRDLV